MPRAAGAFSNAASQAPKALELTPVGAAIGFGLGASLLSTWRRQPPAFAATIPPSSKPTSAPSTHRNRRDRAARRPISCLRMQPSQARERRPSPAEEWPWKRPRTAPKSARINDNSGKYLATSSRSRGRSRPPGACRAVEHDLSTPDHAPATERAYAPKTGPTSRHSAAATASRRSRRPRAKTLALYLKAWRPSVAARRPVSQPGPSASRCRRCVGDSPRSRAATRRPGSRRRRSTPSCAGSCAARAAPEGRPCGRRSAPYRAASGDPDGDARRRARDARSGDVAAWLCRGVSAQRARGARRRAAAVLKDGVLRLDLEREERPQKKGRELFVPGLPATSIKSELCAVAALERWLAIVGPTGPVFRTFDLSRRHTTTRLDSGDVPRVLRRRSLAAGVSGDFAGHS